MVSLLVIDDESRQVRSLSSVIQRYRHNYRIHTAYDGQSGWDILESETIDAVITDIRMPLIDGMELVKLIARKKPHIKMVLLTGYADFQYAREAIRHGVLDYLVKPIGYPDITRVIDKLEMSLACDREQRLQASVYWEHLMQKAFNGSLTARETEHIEQGVLGARCGIGIIFRVEVIEGTALHTGIWHDLLEQLSLRDLHIVYQTEPASGEQVVIAGYSAIRPWHSIVGSIAKSARRLEERLPVRIMAGISQPAALSGASLRTVYRQASQAMRMQFYDAGDTISAYTDRCEPCADAAGLFREREQSLEQSIRAGNWLAVSDTVKQMFDSGMQAQWPDPDSLKREVVRLLLQIGRQFRGAYSDSEAAEAERDMRKSVMSSPNLPALQYAAKKALLDCCDAVCRMQNNKSAIVISQCLDFLDKHYMEEITLESAAKRVRLSPSYFSNYFKNQTGVGFSEYLNRLRIKNASRLLLETDEKVVHIAKEVGFHDAAYFNKMFKRETGLTPNTYRQSAGGASRA